MTVIVTKCIYSMDNFPKWLLSQLHKRDMSQSDLARATGLTRQAISYYISGKSKEPDRDALIAIARALKIPQELVFREAGLLPQKPDVDDWAEEMLYKLSQVPLALRPTAEKIISSIADEGDPKSAAKEHKTTPVKP